MPVVLLQTPVTSAPLRVTLEPGEAVLVGRDPDPSHLSPELPEGVTRVRAVTVPGAAVSGHHCLVWVVGDVVHALDLGSRNGTWLAMRPGTVSTARAEAGLDVTLELARTQNSPARSKPEPAVWASAEEFPHAVVREVARWLTATGANLTAKVVEPGAKEPGQIPLADGYGLALVERSGSGTLSLMFERMLDTVIEYVNEQTARQRAERASEHDAQFVMASPALLDAHRRVVEASVQGIQLVLLGETGAGKSTLARCYHLHGVRRAGPFEVVNCAEVDRHFTRTRLFGARRGAYTGCVSDVVGAVECAHKGTLFLDEVVELPSDVQAALLTFLDDQKFKRLGDSEWRQGDVQVVCGTNTDLRRAVREGRFREDLWYRLAGRVVMVPPLRERPEDVLAYLRGRSAGEGSEALSVYDALVPEARRTVAHEHPWRGNFRELESFVRRLPVASARATISAETVREVLFEGSLEAQRHSSGATASSDGPGGELNQLLKLSAQYYLDRSQGAVPMRATEFREYVEEVLKPVFFAHALGMATLDELPDRPTPTFEEMARRMSCDAGTVRNQLSRYIAIKKASEKG